MSVSSKFRKLKSTLAWFFLATIQYSFETGLDDPDQFESSRAIS